VAAVLDSDASIAFEFRHRLSARSAAEPVSRGLETAFQRGAGAGGGHLDDAAHAIKDGYPMLLARQPELEAAGVEFLDLSGLYAQEQRTMYSDRFCHFNKEGNDILARAIAIRLRELLESSQTD
jgi:hypothetical protein